MARRTRRPPGVAMVTASQGWSGTGTTHPQKSKKSDPRTTSAHSIITSIVLVVVTSSKYGVTELRSAKIH